MHTTSRASRRPPAAQPADPVLRVDPVLRAVAAAAAAAAAAAGADPSTIGQLTLQAALDAAAAQSHLAPGPASHPPGNHVNYMSLLPPDPPAPTTMCWQPVRPPAPSAPLCWLPAPPRVRLGPGGFAEYP